MRQTEKAKLSFDPGFVKTRTFPWSPMGNFEVRDIHPSKTTVPAARLPRLVGETAGGCRRMKRASSRSWWWLSTGRDDLMRKRGQPAKRIAKKT